jgi:hypothetical protein
MFLFTASVRLSQVLHALIINALGIGSLSRADCGNSTPNPDIAGSGVRCSMYILLLFVFVSLAIASFHRQQSGTKELVCTVLISKYLHETGCTVHDLTLNRSLCNELELGFGQAE